MQSLALNSDLTHAVITSTPNKFSDGRAGNQKVPFEWWSRGNYKLLIHCFYFLDTWMKQRIVFEVSISWQRTLEHSVFSSIFFPFFLCFLIAIRNLKCSCYRLVVITYMDTVWKNYIIKLKDSHLPHLEIIPIGNCVNIRHKESKETLIEQLNIIDVHWTDPCPFCFINVLTSLLVCCWWYSVDRLISIWLANPRKKISVIFMTNIS